MSAAEVAERRAAMESLAKQYQAHQDVVNAIMLTTARMNGCGPADQVGLNERGTGVVIVAPVDNPTPSPSPEGRGAETPGMGGDVPEKPRHQPRRNTVTDGVK